MTRHRLGAALVALVVSGLAVLAMASPASAHAQLVSADPAEGTVLGAAPEEVTLTFNESVRLTSQEIRVYDDAGQEVPSEATASGAEVTLTLDDPAAMADGTYVVGWYVVSADGHPISGSLTFSVGEKTSDALEPPPAPTSSRTVVAAVGATHALTYLGLLVATGLTAFVALVVPHRHAGPRLRRRLRNVVRLAAGVAAVGALLQLPLASIYAQGQELADAVSVFDAALVRNEIVFATALLIGLAGVVALLGTTPPSPERRTALLALAGLATVAPTLVGHTRSYQPESLLLAADAGHLVAGAVWLGGLVGLVLSLVELSGRESLAAETLARFSLLAGGLLLAVAATGTVLAWRVLASWSGFVETTYNRLLLVKIGIALVVAGAAAYNRWRLLPRVRAATGFADRGRAAGSVTRAVAVEAVLLVGLLGVTGFLVNQSPRPAPVEVPDGRTGVQDGTAGSLQVLALMSPRQHGPNTLLVQLQDADGEPVEPPRTPVVELRSGDLDLGRVPLTNVDVGSYRAFVLLPQPGTWEVQVSVRESRFENPVTTVRFEVD